MALPVFTKHTIQQKVNQEVTLMLGGVVRCIFIKSLRNYKKIENNDIINKSMQNKQLKVYLIILSWNGSMMTLNCLKSLEKVKCDNFIVKVVVIDNGSTDKSVGRLEELSKSIKSTTGITSITGMKIIKNKENLGFAEGNNVGIRDALKNGADYVCLLNNDTRVSSDFLTQLIKTADSDERIGIVGGKIYFEKSYEFHKSRYKPSDLGKVIWYAGGVMDWNNVYASHRGVNEVDHGQYETEMETEYVNGCLMLVKKEVFEKAGLLDPKYYLYFEENDFCQKAKKTGFLLMYSPKAVIWHLNAGSSGSGSGLHDYFLTRNRLLFGMRWAPLKSKFALVKESIRMLFKGRKWQKVGVRDFYFGKFEKGSWHE